MKYPDGTPVRLGDIVTVPLSDGPHEGRIVMLGDTFENLNLDSEFVKWVIGDKIMDDNTIAVQWTGRNPLEHNDPNYAPVGDMLFTGLDEDIKKRN